MTSQPKNRRKHHLMPPQRKESSRVNLNDGTLRRRGSLLALEYTAPDHSEILRIRNREEGMTPRSHSSQNINTEKLSIEGKVAHNSYQSAKDEVLSSSDNTTDFQKELTQKNNKRFVSKNQSNILQKGRLNTHNLLFAQSSISDFVNQTKNDTIKNERLAQDKCIRRKVSRLSTFQI